MSNRNVTADSVNKTCFLLSTAQEKRACGSIATECVHVEVCEGSHQPYPHSNIVYELLICV